MMAGLQRSSISFRRQGSSGLVWDDKILTGEINQQKEEESAKKPRQEIEVEIVEKKSDLETGSAMIEIKRSRSDGGRGTRAGKVSSAIEPPSPKVSVCGFCSGFSKTEKKRQRLPKSGKRVM